MKNLSLRSESSHNIQPKNKIAAAIHPFIVFVVILTSLVPVARAQGFQAFNTDFLRRNVVFIKVPCDQVSPEPAGCVPGTLMPWGTGFLVTVPHKGGGDYLLLATARHMVDPGFSGCTKTGPTELHAFYNKAGFSPDQKDTQQGTVDKVLSNAWKFPDDDSADVAVTLLVGHDFDSWGTENQGVNIRDFPTDEETNQVKTGDQIISAGLLMGASGANRNYPIFKFGYVSSIPGEKIGEACCPSCTTSKYLSQWMLAASLVPGNSGSPIYFVPSVFQFAGTKANQRALLLGVQSTAFLGSDVAGMTPVKYLVEAIRKLDLVDADMTITGQPYKPVVASATK